MLSVAVGLAHRPPGPWRGTRRGWPRSPGAPRVADEHARRRGPVAIVERLEAVANLDPRSREDALDRGDRRLPGPRFDPCDDRLRYAGPRGKLSLCETG